MNCCYLISLHVSRILLTGLLFAALAAFSHRMTSAAPTNGLAAYYPLDGDASDLSGNENHGTISAALPTTDRFGNANAALDFDGVSASIKAAVKGLPVGSAPRSLSLWAKARSGASQGPYDTSLVEWGSTEPGTAWGIIKTGGPSVWGLKLGTFAREIREIRGLQLVDTNWHHLAATYSGAIMTLYLDGRMLGRVAQAINTAPSLLSVGVRAGVGAQGLPLFAGAIDEIRIYNRELANTEVQELAEVSAGVDSDGDGLSDSAELLLYHTDPVNRDSDGDFVPDGAEIRTGTNPLDRSDSANAFAYTRTAVELEFFAEMAKSYVLQTSSDLKIWETLEIINQSTNGIFKKYYSTRLPKNFFYRVKAASTNNTGIPPEGLVGRHLQLKPFDEWEIGSRYTFYTPSINFPTASKFEGKTANGQLAAGGYSYTRAASTASLRMDFIDPPAYVYIHDFYDLRFTFSSEISGTFSGIQHYLGGDREVAGTFSLTALAGPVAPTAATNQPDLAGDTLPPSLTVHPALEFSYLPDNRAYLLQYSADLKTWNTLDTLNEPSTATVKRFYSIRDPKAFFYRMEPAPLAAPPEP